MDVGAVLGGAGVDIESFAGARVDNDVSVVGLVIGELKFLGGGLVGGVHPDIGTVFGGAGVDVEDGAESRSDGVFAG